MTYYLNGREVEQVQIAIEVNEGAYVVDALWVDSGEPLTESECEALQESYQDVIYQFGMENLAALAYDRAKDLWKYGE